MTTKQRNLQAVLSSKFMDEPFVPIPVESLRRKRGRGQSTAEYLRKARLPATRSNCLLFNLAGTICFVILALWIWLIVEWLNRPGPTPLLAFEQIPFVFVVPGMMYLFTYRRWPAFALAAQSTAALFVAFQIITPFIAALALITHVHISMHSPYVAVTGWTFFLWRKSSVLMILCACVAHLLQRIIFVKQPEKLRRSMPKRLSYNSSVSLSFLFLIIFLFWFAIYEASLSH
jgi:hypothetical protein